MKKKLQEIHMTSKFTFFVYKMEKIFLGNNFHSVQHMTTIG